MDNLNNSLFTYLSLFSSWKNQKRILCSITLEYKEDLAIYTFVQFEGIGSLLKT